MARTLRQRSLRNPHLFLLLLILPFSHRHVSIIEQVHVHCNTYSSITVLVLTARPLPQDRRWVDFYHGLLVILG